MLSGHAIGFRERSSEELLLADPVAENDDDEEALSGCLQSSYGLHTFRIESIAHRKAASVDELQFQGVSSPELLRKVIVTEAAKSIQKAGSRKVSGYPGEGIFTPRMRSLTEIPSISRLQSPTRKVRASPRRALFDAGRVISSDVLLRKLEEIIQSLKHVEQKIESLVVGSRS